MSKVIGLKLTNKDKELIKQIESSGLSNSELLRKALKRYFQSVNRNHKEKTMQRVNRVNQMVNRSYKEKQDNTVNHKVQVTENYELMEYLRRDHEWLKDRIEHFEHTQDRILAKIDTKLEKPQVSWFRM